MSGLNFLTMLLTGFSSVMFLPLVDNISVQFKESFNVGLTSAFLYHFVSEPAHREQI